MFDFFIDVDDTLLTEHAAPHDELFLERRLMAMLRDMCVVVHGMPAIEAEATLTLLEHQTAFWCWGDFVKALGLSEERFWSAADKYMAARCSPCASNVASVLRALHEQGHRLWMTSNNPSDGIAHKLRLAGVNASEQAELFFGFLGTDAVHAMKWDAKFWRRAVSLAGTTADRVVVVGDNPHDDMMVPAEAGITRGIIVPAAGRTEPLPVLCTGWTLLQTLDSLPSVIATLAPQPALIA
jgi:FMN phosphatase YigB (HAD superfamily)